MKDMWIYVIRDNEEPKFFHIYENLDEQLWAEDFEEGYVDFFNYEVHRMDVWQGMFTASDAEEDSQMVMTEKSVDEMTKEDIVREAVNDYWDEEVYDEVHMWAEVVPTFG